MTYDDSIEYSDEPIMHAVPNAPITKAPPELLDEEVDQVLSEIEAIAQSIRTKLDTMLETEKVDGETIDRVL